MEFKAIRSSLPRAGEPSESGQSLRFPLLFSRNNRNFMLRKNTPPLIFRISMFAT
jgi:hypothetical protein